VRLVSSLGKRPIQREMAASNWTALTLQGRFNTVSKESSHQVRVKNGQRCSRGVKSPPTKEGSTGGLLARRKKNFRGLAAEKKDPDGGNRGSETKGHLRKGGGKNVSSTRSGGIPDKNCKFGSARVGMEKEYTAGRQSNSNRRTGAAGQGMPEGGPSQGKIWP